MGRSRRRGSVLKATAAVVVCAALSFGCGPDPAEEAKKHLKEGIAHYQKGEFEAAAKAFNEALRLKPDNAEARAHLGLATGNTHYQKGELEAAAKAFQEALRLKPDYAEAHSRLGLTYAVLGERDKAIAEYEWLEKGKPAMAGRLATVLAGMPAAPQAEGGKEAKKATAILRLQEVRVEPARAAAGSSVKIVLEYAVGGADQAVREERRIERDGSAFGRFADTFFRLPGKKYTSKKSVTIPEGAAPGAYTVVGSVASAGQVKSKRATLQVTER